jgi:hypothetical protein
VYHRLVRALKQCYAVGWQLVTKPIGLKEALKSGLGFCLGQLERLRGRLA